MEKQFETERLIIRPINIEDAEYVFLQLNTESWIRYIGDRKVNSLADAKKYIEVKMLPQFERLGFGNFVLELRESGEIIGSCGLYDRKGLEGFDIGFALLPEWEGKGYAFESSSLMLDKGFSLFGIDLVHAITTEDNYPSQKLIKKLGLRYVKLINLPDDPVTLQLYSLNKKDYLKT